MGGCRNYGPFLGLYYNTAPIINGTQKGTLILTTTQMAQFEEKFLDRSPQAPLPLGLGVRGLGFRGLGFRVETLLKVPEFRA